MQPYARVSDCVKNYLDRVLPYGLEPVVAEIYRCAGKAASCADLRDCFGAGSSCDASFKARCDGGEAIYCDLLDHRAYRYRCGAAKLECRVDAQNTFAATCTGGGASPRPLATTAECPRDGCTRTGQACSSDALDRCAGDALESCLDGQWVRFDCAGLGLGACLLSATGTARCGAMP